MTCTPAGPFGHAAAGNPYQAREGRIMEINLNTVPDGALDLARVRREGNEIVSRSRREKEAAESGRSAGRRRGLKQHTPER